MPPFSPASLAVLIEPVPASALPAFRRQAGGRSGFSLTARRHLQVVPSGNRPVYCLTRAIVGTSAATSLFPPLLDYCAPVLPGIGRSPYAALIRDGDRHGLLHRHPATGANSSLAAIGAAVYRRGAPIATIPERRAAVSGLIATTFDSFDADPVRARRASLADAGPLPQEQRWPARS